jgi:hypothetical protein
MLYVASPLICWGCSLISSDTLRGACECRWIWYQAQVLYKQLNRKTPRWVFAACVVVAPSYGVLQTICFVYYYEAKHRLGYVMFEVLLSFVAYGLSVAGVSIYVQLRRHLTQFIGTAGRQIDTTHIAGAVPSVVLHAACVHFVSHATAAFIFRSCIAQTPGADRLLCGYLCGCCHVLPIPGDSGRWAGVQSGRVTVTCGSPERFRRASDHRLHRVSVRDSGRLVFGAATQTVGGTAGLRTHVRGPTAHPSAAQSRRTQPTQRRGSV